MISSNFDWNPHLILLHTLLSFSFSFGEFTEISFKILEIYYCSFLLFSNFEHLMHLHGHNLVCISNVS